MSGILTVLSSQPEDDRCIVFHEGDITEENGVPLFTGFAKFRRGALEGKGFSVEGKGDTAVILKKLISLYTLYGLSNEDFSVLCKEYTEDTVIQIKENDYLLEKDSFHGIARKIISSVANLKMFKDPEILRGMHESTKFAVLCDVSRVKKRHFYEGCPQRTCYYKSMTERMGANFVCPKCSYSTETPERSVVFKVTIQGDGHEEEVAIFTSDVLRLSGVHSVDLLEELSDENDLLGQFEGKRLVVVVRPNIYEPDEYTEIPQWHVTQAYEVSEQ